MTSLHLLTTDDGARWGQQRDAAGEPIAHQCRLARPATRGSGAMPVALFTARLATLTADRAALQAERMIARLEPARRYLESFR